MLVAGDEHTRLSARELWVLIQMNHKWKTNPRTADGGSVSVLGRAAGAAKGAWDSETPLPSSA